MVRKVQKVWRDATLFSFKTPIFHFSRSSLYTGVLVTCHVRLRNNVSNYIFFFNYWIF